jgi:hypothetical protein
VQLSLLHTVYDTLDMKLDNWLCCVECEGKIISDRHLHVMLDRKPLKLRSIDLRLFLQVQRHHKFHASFLRVDELWKCVDGSQTTVT